MKLKTNLVQVNLQRWKMIKNNQLKPFLELKMNLLK
jgi:hypothetical protein